MVEEDKYCIDILTQVSAASRALQSFALGLLDEHMAHCLVEATRAGGEEEATKLKEASDAIARLVRSRSEERRVGKEGRSRWAAEHRRRKEISETHRVEDRK